MALKFLIDSNIDTFLEKDQQKKEKHFDIVCVRGEVFLLCEFICCDRRRTARCCDQKLRQSELICLNVACSAF